MNSEEQKIRFEQDKKDFDELLTRIVKKEINDDNIIEFETTFENTLKAFDPDYNFFHVADAFGDLLIKISTIDEHKKIYNHLKLNEEDIYKILNYRICLLYTSDAADE